MGASEVIVRAAGADDRAAVVDLCRTALRWNADDPNEEFFAWKHDANPFGRSRAWVAEEGGRLIGVRMFLTWRFRTTGGHTVLAVRAVDTATHPEARGRGIFSKLTLGSLPDLRSGGVAFVFNTPNTQSRPGYLKMGWSTVGRVPVAVRVAGVGAVPNLLGARVAAGKWSEKCDVGLAGSEAFVNDDEVDRLLRRRRVVGVSTDRDAAFLRWRYSFEPLNYRVLPVGDRLADGVVIMRLRRRGEAVEATLADAIAPTAAVGAVVGSFLRATGADYAIAGGGAELLRAGFVPARLGPILTWKPLGQTGVPGLRDLDLALGDVELF